MRRLCRLKNTSQAKPREPSRRPNEAIPREPGALLAKGRLLGVQFDTLFTDGLYFKLGAHAISMAERLKEVFAAHGIEFYAPSPTNQQFVVLENERMERLSKNIAFSFWEKADEAHTVVRFAASWSTASEDIAALDKALSE